MLDKDVVVGDSSIVGPNKKKYNHFYFSYGNILGASETDSVAAKIWGSYEFAFGYRFKYRVSQFYSLGFGINYNSKTYNIKQDSFKLFPNNVVHKWEKLVLRNLAFDVYNRFNYGKRGNYIGNFIDIGAYADWSFMPVYVSYDEYTLVNSVSASNTRQIHKGLVYVNTINYGVNARLGFNKYVLYASYRLSDIFKPGYIYTELPRIVAGIQIGLHK